jgi:hypothetical protein
VATAFRARKTCARASVIKLLEGVFGGSERLANG